MRLIDADALALNARTVQTIQGSRVLKDAVAVLLTDIDAQPTVDAVPVRHAKWIITVTRSAYGGILIECSECHDRVMVQNVADEMYCRHCGARMDEE